MSTSKYDVFFEYANLIGELTKRSKRYELDSDLSSETVADLAKTDLTKMGYQDVVIEQVTGPL